MIALTAFSTHNLFKLKQEFDQSWFIPDTTYLHYFLQKHHEYFPDTGLESGIYMGKLNYTMELPKICKLVELMKNRTEMVYDVNAWINPFRNFTEMYFQKGCRHIYSKIYLQYNVMLCQMYAVVILLTMSLEHFFLSFCTAIAVVNTKQILNSKGN